ncbi:hypothetical protein PSV08DRAFT_404128 [Bipolaris maydis]|nr:hypothetical protein J3E74DRAFT_472130 [Bipolaris maydis]KAJ6267819.1 hypothetical protein PSV08DRAFT_404128 [Bipolaris maydis]KAJ6277064.1 hypothetical protein J3E71DRAFT_402911 [Bipolaris maydis]
MDHDSHGPFFCNGPFGDEGGGGRRQAMGRQSDERGDYQGKRKPIGAVQARQTRPAHSALLKTQQHGRHTSPKHCALLEPLADMARVMSCRLELPSFAMAAATRACSFHIDCMPHVHGCTRGRERAPCSPSPAPGRPIAGQQMDAPRSAGSPLAIGLLLSDSHGESRMDASLADRPPPQPARSCHCQPQTQTQTGRISEQLCRIPPRYSATPAPRHFHLRPRDAMSTAPPILLPLPRRLPHYVDHHHDYYPTTPPPTTLQPPHTPHWYATLIGASGLANLLTTISPIGGRCSNLHDSTMAATDRRQVIAPHGLFSLDLGGGTIMTAQADGRIRGHRSRHVTRTCLVRVSQIVVQSIPYTTTAIRKASLRHCTSCLPPTHDTLV